MGEMNLSVIYVKFGHVRTIFLDNKWLHLWGSGKGVRSRYSLDLAARSVTLCAMARRPRNIQGGLVYHVLNRATARTAIFRKDEDYAAFERVLGEVPRRRPPPRLQALSRLHPRAW